MRIALIIADDFPDLKCLLIAFVYDSAVYQTKALWKQEELREPLILEEGCAHYTLMKLKKFKSANFLKSGSGFRRGSENLFSRTAYEWESVKNL